MFVITPVINHQFIIHKNYGAEAFRTAKLVVEWWEREIERVDDERWERGKQIYRRVYSRFDSQTLNSLPWKHTRPWYQQLVAATRQPAFAFPESTQTRAFRTESLQTTIQSVRREPGHLSPSCLRKESNNKHPSNSLSLIEKEMPLRHLFHFSLPFSFFLPSLRNYKITRNTLELENSSSRRAY